MDATPRPPKPSIRIVWPSPRTLVRPRKMARVPSVVINALMPTIVTQKPLMRPMTRAAAPR